MKEFLKEFQTVIPKQKCRYGRDVENELAVSLGKKSRPGDYTVYYSQFYVGKNIANKAGIEKGTKVDIRKHPTMMRGVILKSKSGRSLIKIGKSAKAYSLKIVMPDSLYHIKKLTTLENVSVEDEMIFFDWPGAVKGGDNVRP